jgi:hypothetical protein
MSTLSCIARTAACWAVLLLTASASGQTALPIGAAPLGDPVNTLWLYTGSDFSDREAWLTINETSHPAGTPHELGRGIKGKVSSIRWNLVDNVVVVFYTSSKGTGRQLAVWGSGTFGSLKPYNINGKIKAWAWFRVGDSSQSTKDFPMQAGALNEVLEDNSCRVFKSKNLENEIGSIRSVTASAAGATKELESAIDRDMASLTWNLPSGVVLVFYEKADGTGRQLAVWGSGQFVNLETWDFKKKARAWAWFQVGSGSGQEPLGSPGPD